MNIEAIQPLEGQTYKDYMEYILSSRENIKNTKQYMERHHIIPRSQGGQDEEDNLIYLLPEEHYYAHELLALENPEEKSLLYAWWMMSNRFGEKVNANQYKELREKFSRSASINNSGEKNPFFGKNHTEEHKAYIAQAITGLKRFEETKEKIRQAAIGRATFLGRHHSEESKKKMLENSHPTKVKCVETGEIYPSAREASRTTGVNQGSISRCVKGERQTAGGYHWEKLK